MATESALSGIRVIEVARGRAAPFAGKMLAAYGAEVIKVEPPGGDSARSLVTFPGDEPHPERSPLFLYENTGKRSLVLDLDDPVARAQFEQLARSAHVVLEDTRPGTMAAWGLAYEALAALNPRLVMTSVTTFGQNGPYAGFRSANLVTAAVGGQMHMMGNPDREPLKNGGYIADYQAGLNAFAATLVALHGAAQSGCGEHVDVAAMQCHASVLEGAMPAWAYRGIDTSMRRGNILASFIGLYPCSDGQIGIHVMASNWGPFVQAADLEVLRGDERFATQRSRFEHNDELTALMYQWAGPLRKREIYERAGGLRAPISFVHTVEDLLASPQLTARNFFSVIDHPQTGKLTYPGAPFRMSETPGAIERAPLLGEHSDELLSSLSEAEAKPRSTAPSERLPLEGVRVLDLSMVWAGPYCTRLLADMGAEVIKIESLEHWDQLRALSGLPPGTERDYNKSAYFNHNNRNKLGITLDLKSERGRALFLDLVRISDVVIENYRAEVMEQLGLGYEDLRGVREDIILISMPSHGKDGPERDYVAYGTNMEQLAGIVSVSGYEDGEPQKSGISFGDPTAGTMAAGAIAAALLYRRRSGRGQYIDLAQREALVSFVGEQLVAYSMTGRLPALMGNGHPQHAPHDVFPCAPLYEGDDPWVAIACESDADFAALCHAIGRPELASDPRFRAAGGRQRHRHELTEPIAEWTRRIDKYRAMHELQAAGVAAGAVLGVRDLTADDHLRARGFWERVDHADAGSWEMEGPAWVLTGHPARIRRPPPRFGEHHDYVLRDLLSLDSTTIAELERAGIVGMTPVLGRHV